MKLFKFLSFLAFSAALGLSSCNEDIDFTGDNQKTAVVYCLLNQADTLHYLKITKAFGGGNNALEVAQIPDSSYFTTLDVTVSEVINNSVVRTWKLGDPGAGWIHDTIVTNKEPGVFYSPEQKLYYFRAALNPVATYKLDVNVNNGEYHVTGETKLVQNLAITSPSGTSPCQFASSNVPDDGYKTTNVIMNAGTAEVLNGKIEVFFNEYIGAVATEKSFIWNLGEMTGNEIVPNNPRFTANGSLFYQLIRDNVTDDQAITRRTFTRLKIYVTGGSPDLAKYLLVNKPSSSLAQNKPTFTNLEATDGAIAIGLFSARATVTLEKIKFQPGNPGQRGIDLFSIRELCNGLVTGGLLFCSDNPNDALTDFYCN